MNTQPSQDNISQNYGTITVVNGRDTGFFGIDRVYIGRENKERRLQLSPLANPYRVDKDGTAEECDVKYQDWLNGRVRIRDRLVTNELKRVAGLVRDGYDVKLCCWCKDTEKCHGQIVKKFVLRMLK